MYYRSITTILTPVLIALASLTTPQGLYAQVALARGPGVYELSATSLYTALAVYRSVRWSSAAPPIHCSPAPLTERPGIQAEFARPHVVPLEEALADAESVKRAVAYRARRVAMENR